MDMLLLIFIATQEQQLFLKTEMKYLYLKGDSLGCTQYNSSLLTDRSDVRILQDSLRLGVFLFDFLEEYSTCLESEHSVI